MISLLLFAILITLLGAWSFVGGAALIIAALVVGILLLWVGWKIFVNLAFYLYEAPGRLRSWWREVQKMSWRERFSKVFVKIFGEAFDMRKILKTALIALMAILLGYFIAFALFRLSVF